MIFCQLLVKRNVTLKGEVYNKHLSIINLQINNIGLDIELETSTSSTCDRSTARVTGTYCSQELKG